MQATIHTSAPKRIFFIVCLMALLLGTGGKSWGQIITYPVSSLSGTTSGSVSSSGSTTGITYTSSTLSRGSGLTAASASGGYNSSVSTTAANNYYVVTVVAAANYKIAFGNFSVTLQKSSSGPTGATLYSSADNYTTALSTFSNLTTGNVTYTADISSLTNQTGTTTFRIYATGATTGNIRISSGTGVTDGISITGTVTSTGTIIAPTVSTTAASAITTTTATSGGNVTATGGAALTAKGVVWSTTAGVTTANATGSTNDISSGTGTGTYTSSLTGLTANTLYYYNAYATNTAGTGYGTEANFTTLSNPPVVGTPTAATTTGFTANWTAPATQGTATYTYTVEASTSNTFGTIAATGSGIASGTLSYTFTTLSSGTTYYFRVRAVNAGGSSANSAVSTAITTLTPASTASDIIVDATYTNQTSIDYTQYQAVAPIPASGTGSIDVFRFIMRDGGASADADALPTILSSITFSSITNISSIRSAALFNGSTLVSNTPTISTGSSTITFSGLSGASVTAADNGTATFTLRVSFNTTVTEGQLRLLITNTGVTAASTSTSSQFTTFSQVQSSAVSTTINRVSVTATQLAFLQQPPATVTAGSVITPSVTVKGTDANGSTDIDFASAVTLALTSTTVCNSLSGNTATASAGVATFTSLTVNVAESNISLTASSGSLGIAISTTFSATGGSSNTGVVVIWDFEDQNLVSDAGTNANNTSDAVSTVGGTGTIVYTGGAGSSANSASATGWDGGSGTKYWYANPINTTGYQSLTLSSKQRSSPTGPANFKIQYQVGSSGTWTDLYTVPAAGDNFTQAVASNVALPSACDNQPVVNIRWIMTSNTAVGGGTVAAGGTSRIDDIVVSGQTKTLASSLYYRSVLTGNFGSACSWETSTDGVSNWVAATVPPDISSKSITIRSGYTISINSTRIVDELVVDNGGTLILNNYALTINDGTGTDFIVNGTFQDNSTSVNNVVFNSGAKWKLGSAGTFIKSNTSSAAVYRDNYEGGMSTIPATANWIIRKSTATSVEFTVVDTYYPNLTFDNVTTTPFTFSSTASNSGYMQVLGNLDIGGTGATATNAVTFVNNNYNASPMLVNGNLTVRASSALTNAVASGTPGTGFELKGNLIVAGTLTADAGSATGTFNFTGTTQQTISGAGTINLNNVVANNSTGVLLSTGRSLTVGGALTLTSGPFAINGNTLTLNGAVTHAINGSLVGSITGSATSDMVLNGSASKALYFTPLGNILHNVTINSGATAVVLDNALDITAGTAPGTVICNGNLQTNGFLTLKSDINGTAAVGANTSGSASYISGNVTVERYTDASQSAGSWRRAWRLMTSPVSGPTIHAAWQENQSSNVDPGSGFGTLITGYNMPSASVAAAKGYDFIASGLDASIKHYDITAGSWQPLPSGGTGTLIPVRDEQAYLLFVRGDRSVQTKNGSSIARLRAVGTLLQGNQQVTLSAGSYTVVGNPYASSIDFKSIYNHNNTLIQNQFYLWNSKLGSYGAYVLIRLNPDNSGNYQAVPTASLGTQSNDAYRYIPSGSGFFVSPTAAGTPGTLITIQESDKAGVTNPPISPFRVVTSPSNVRQLYVNLNQLDSNRTANLADGFLAMFSDDYTGNEKDNSALKLVNFYENLGLESGDNNLIVEARSDVRKTDTLHMKMWNISKPSYQLQMKADNFASAPGIQAWLADSYLKTTQPVDLTGNITTIGFDVNSDSGSWAANRFMIVFSNSAALPVTITKVSAQPKNSGVEVSWSVANETNVKGYTVEKSTDGGRTFSSTGTQQAAHNNPQAAVTSYSGYDATPKTGDNYYRIRIEAKDGSITYSTVVKVAFGSEGSRIEIVLYPNPVREGKANLKLANLKEGTYLVSLYTQSGQAVYQQKIYISQTGITQTEPLVFGKQLAQGSYQVRVTDGNGKILKEDRLVIIR